MRRIRHGNAHLHNYSRRLQRNRLGNPLFATARQHARPRIENWRAIGKAISVVVPLLACGALVGYALWGPWFRIKNVEVNGASPLTEKAVRDLVDARLAKTRLLFLPERNSLLFDSSGFNTELGQSFLFDSLKIATHLPDRLTVDIKEKPLRAAYLSDGKFYALDASALVIRELFVKELAELGELPPGYAAAMAPQPDAAMIEIPTTTLAATGSENPRPALDGATNQAKARFPITVAEPVEGRPGQPKRPGDAAFPPTTLVLVQQAAGRLSDVAGTPVKWYSVRDNGETVEAATSEGWRILLSSSLPFEAQAARLALVLKDKVGSDRSRLDYVDLRYNDRIFFRFRDQAPTEGSTPEEPKKTATGAADPKKAAAPPPQNTALPKP